MTTDVTVRLGGREILGGVSLSLKPGQVTCIVGPNGAGKSTLMACLAGLRRPDRGAVCLGRTPVLSMPTRGRARRIGFLPQISEVAWAVEAEALVALGRIPYAAGGPGEEGRAAVARAMALTGVEDLMHRTVDTLSGGERGRVLIARALAGEPEWLLADEPLTGLDVGHQIDACDLFHRLARDQGRGVVVTLHDLSMALRVADRVLVLNDGAIIADGTGEDALSPQVIRQAYGVEVRVLAGTYGPTLELLRRHEP